MFFYTICILIVIFKSASFESWEGTFVILVILKQSKLLRRLTGALTDRKLALNLLVPNILFIFLFTCT